MTERRQAAHHHHRRQGEERSERERAPRAMKEKKKREPLRGGADTKLSRSLGKKEISCGWESGWLVQLELPG